MKEFFNMLFALLAIAVIVAGAVIFPTKLTELTEARAELEEARGDRVLKEAAAEAVKAATAQAQAAVATVYCAMGVLGLGVILVLARALGGGARDVDVLPPSQSYLVGRDSDYIEGDYREAEYAQLPDWENH